MNKNKCYVAEINERPLVSIDKECFRKVHDHKQQLAEIKSKGIVPLGIKVIRSY